MIRQGFVSNSSSSSFIVYNPKKAGNEYFDIKDYDFYEIEGNTAKVNLPYLKGDYCDYFGWDVVRYYDFVDKLNFLCLNYAYSGNKLFKEIFEEGLLKIIQRAYPDVTEIKLKSDTKALDKGLIDIDHGSVICPNYYDSFYRVYRDVDSMVEFLMNKTFYVQGSNDGDGDESDESMESMEFVLGGPYKALYDLLYLDDNLTINIPKEYKDNYLFKVGVCKECGSPIYYESNPKDKYGNDLVSKKKLYLDKFSYEYYSYDISKYREYVDIANLTIDGLNVVDFNIGWNGYFYCGNEECNHSKPHAYLQNITLDDNYSYIDWKIPFVAVDYDKNIIPVLEGEDLRKHIIQKYRNYEWLLISVNYKLKQLGLRKCSKEEYEAFELEGTE